MASSKILVHVFLSFLTLLVCSSSNINADSKEVCNQNPLSNIILSFCSRLVKEIGGEENFFFSPLSISAALAMIYIGTEGTTELQMSNALQYYLEGEKCLKLRISDEFRMLIDSLESKKDDPLKLFIANGMFIHVGYTISAEYTSRLQDFFKANVNYLDFANEEKLSLKNINEWTSYQTKGMVPQLLNEPLDPLTILVILNVIYFKGLWKVPFLENSTFNGNFNRLNGTRKIVPLMIADENFNYYYDSDSKNHFLQMNYLGGNFSMLLILPENIREFPKFELNRDTLCLLKSKLEPQDLTVILPKFRLEYKRELSKDMMNLGINEIFSDRADLSGIRKQNDVHVSLMVHQAVIEVNEHGSEAAGVSGVGIDARRKPVDHITLLFNHPFLFYIIHQESNLILFAGRVADP